MDETGECAEHFRYKGSEVLKENYLPSCLDAWVVEDEESDLSEEDLKKYIKIEEANVYVLKDEFREDFVYDEDLGEAVFHFTMSFRDLPGYEDDEENAKESNPFDNKEALLAMMGFCPETNESDAFDIVDFGDSKTLYEYRGTAETVIVPDGVNNMEFCFSGNKTVREVILPLKCVNFS